jgi:hypothetical protein
LTELLLCPGQTIPYVDAGGVSVPGHGEVLRVV